MRRCIGRSSMAWRERATAVLSSFVILEPPRSENDERGPAIDIANLVAKRGVDLFRKADVQPRDAVGAAHDVERRLHLTPAVHHGARVFR